MNFLFAIGTLLLSPLLLCLYTLYEAVHCAIIGRVAWEQKISAEDEKRRKRLRDEGGHV